MEQHNNKLRWIIFAALMALAAWKLFPTVRLALMDETAFKALKPEAQVELRKDAIKRGLDLQGGMHMVLEVDLAELLRGLARTPDARFNERMGRVTTKLTPLTDFWEIFEKEFSDIQLSEYYGERKQSNDEILAMLKQQATDAVDNSLVILRNRVDGSGLQEPSITKQGQRRIVVELAGVNDPEAARRMIGKTALLEFKLVEEVGRTNQILESINAVVKGEPMPTPADSGAVDSSAVAQAKPDSAATKAEPATAKIDSAAAFDPLAARTLTADSGKLAKPDSTKAIASFFELLTIFPGRNSLLISEPNRSRVLAVLGRPDVQEQIPPDKEFLLGKTENVNGTPFSELFLVHKEAELTGKALESAGVNINQGGNGGSAGAAIVELAMTREGARRFARITGDNVNRRLAIVLDNKVFMAPNIRNKIPNGRAIIEGLESIEEAKELANLLKHGALPSTVKPVEERTVGPSLGAESLRQGAMSALLAFVFTVAFMMIYYKLSGVYAILAMIANMLFILASMAGFHATLTLPGIAGLVLTIGMSVDANILVLERIREELRKGRTIRSAVDAGYTNAMSAIIDSNLTTLIAGVVLYQFGSGPIRGFALTLMIGLVANLYTAIIITRLLYDRFTNYDRATRLSI